MQPECLQQGTGKPYLFAHTPFLPSIFQAPLCHYLVLTSWVRLSTVTKVLFGAHPIPWHPPYHSPALTSKSSPVS